MTDSDLRALRDALESQARQPSFDVISGRRHRRTRRWATAGAACLTVMLLASVTWIASGRPNTEPPAAPEPSKVASVTGHSSGTLFALDAVTGDIQFSTDRGGRWRKLVSGLGYTGPGQLAAANANSTWLIGATEVWYITELSWTSSGTGSLNNGVSLPTGAFSVAKERLWLIAGGKVSIWTASRNPLPTNDTPSPAVNVAALSAEAALVMTEDGKWYYTYDSGTRWALRPDPCAVPQTSSVHAAPDRSLWAICASGSLFVSTNDGESWQPRGAITWPAFIRPVSQTAAWCTTPDAGILRSLDGAGWQRTNATLTSGPQLTAIDEDTAIYLSTTGHAQLTNDGGATWNPLRF
jgi:hypothetical protein